MRTAEVYSDGARIVGLESVVGYDLENPMSFWNEGLEAPVYIVSRLWEFTKDQPRAYEDVRGVIEDQPSFTGDVDLMSRDHIRAYIDKHFYAIPFSKGEHGLSWYSVGRSRDWDCVTAGFFFLPKSAWSAARANDYATDLNNLMECMSAWANGDEYAVHDISIENGSIIDECCFGYYGSEDARSAAEIEGYEYLGEFDPEDENKLFPALMKRFPERYAYVEHTEHIPEKVIPAHVEVWQEFARVS